MADSDLPGLSALTGAGTATGDLFHVVDVSDTSAAADGTDKKITAAELAIAITTLGALATDAEVAAGYQPLDSDLTAIAALSPSNDDIVQRKAGAWTNRTIAQLLTDLNLDATYATDSDLTAHVSDSSAAHAASAISADSTTLVGTGTDVQAVLEELDNGIADHLADTSDAHDASAISILDAANDFTATDVEGALAELQSDNEAHVAAPDPHTGYVLESLFDANTIIAANSDNTPVAVTVAEERLVGRITSGNITALTAAQVRTFADVPSNAEAVLDTLYDAQSVVAAVSDNTPAAITITEETVLGRITGGNVAAVNPSSIAQTLRTSTSNMTLVIADAGKILQFNKGTAGTITIPSSSSVNFPTGTRVDFVQLGAGAATLTAGTTGVAINCSTQLTKVTNGQYSGGTMYKRAANTWVAFGDLTPA
jgi:hypothetical protein